MKDIHDQFFKWSWSRNMPQGEKINLSSGDMSTAERFVTAASSLWRKVVRHLGQSKAGGDAQPTPIRFRYNHEKAIEALLYVATKWPGVDVFHVSKIFFFAEEEHVNDYGHPIVGDDFKALPYGPVPDRIYNAIRRQAKRHHSRVPFRVTESPHTSIEATRAPRMDHLARSNTAALDRAIEKCRNGSFSSLSNETHRRIAYERAAPNGLMDYELLIREDNPWREDQIEHLRLFAVYGVL